MPKPRKNNGHDRPSKFRQARRRGKGEDNRHTLYVRLDEADKERLEREAGAARLSLSAFVRNRLLARPLAA